MSITVGLMPNSMVYSVKSQFLSLWNTHTLIIDYGWPAIIGNMKFRGYDIIPVKIIVSFFTWEESVEKAAA